MIRTIETSLDLSISLNSLQEQFYFDMTMAWKIHGTTPNEFRSIYSSDYNIIKRIGYAIDERNKIQNEQDKIKQEMQIEMNKRRSQIW